MVAHLLATQGNNFTCTVGWPFYIQHRTEVLRVTLGDSFTLTQIVSFTYNTGLQFSILHRMACLRVKQIVSFTYNTMWQFYV